MKFSMGGCKALHLGQKNKTSRAPSHWGEALWRRPWVLPSLPNFLGIPRWWALPTNLGFPSHPSLHTYTPLRLQGSPAQASQPQQGLLHALLLPHQLSSELGSAATPAPEGWMAVLPTLQIPTSSVTLFKTKVRFLNEIHVGERTRDLYIHNFILKIGFMQMYFQPLPTSRKHLPGARQSGTRNVS